MKTPHPLLTNDSSFLQLEVDDLHDVPGADRRDGGLLGHGGLHKVHGHCGLPELASATCTTSFSRQGALMRLLFILLLANVGNIFTIDPNHQTQRIAEMSSSMSSKQVHNCRRIQWYSQLMGAHHPPYLPYIPLSKC